MLEGRAIVGAELRHVGELHLLALRHGLLRELLLLLLLLLLAAEHFQHLKNRRRREGVSASGRQEARRETGGLMT